MGAVRSAHCVAGGSTRMAAGSAAGHMVSVTRTALDALAVTTASLLAIANRRPDDVITVLAD